MADEIALMRAGQIAQRGAPYNIYNAPVDKRAVAFFSTSMRCAPPSRVACRYGLWSIFGTWDQGWITGGYCVSPTACAD